MDDSSAALEAELASLAAEAESELLHDTGAADAADTSVASSQLTAFLVQHGVLSPLRPPVALSSSGAGAMAAAAAAALRPTRGTARVEEQQREQQQQDVSYEIVMTPERRRHYSPSHEGARQPHRPPQEAAVVHSPCSGISSLGLASPPHRAPMLSTAAQVGTGGEPLWKEAAPPAAAAAAEGASSRDGWAAVSQLLRSEGYRTGSSGEGPEEVLGALRQVMADLRDGREVLRAQLLERQRGDSDRRVYESQLEGVERAGRSLHGSLAAAEAKARGLEAELDRAKRAAAEQVRKAKVKAAQAAARLKQGEQRARAQEAEMDKVVARLEAMKEREAKEKERERAAFRRLVQRDPRPNETKWVEMLGALDGARQRSVEEAEVLREEVRVLRASLTQKEAYIAQRHEAVAGGKGRSGADGGAPAVAGGAGMQQLLGQLHASERALAQAERQAQAAMRRADALETVRGEAAARLAGLEEEGGRLRRELQNRPTLKAWRGAQKRIEELEARLKELQQQESQRGSRAAGLPVRRSVGGLTGVDASSTEELRALVGAVCRVLELADPRQVLPAVETMRAAMEAIPPLEGFVKDVCAFLARETLSGGAHLSPEEALSRMDLPGAQRALRAWAKEAKAAGRLRRFQSRLRTIVATRDGEVGDDQGVLVLDDEQLLATVQGLVALEHRTLRSEGAREAAEAYLAGRPELLVNRAVQHFRYLFQVKGLEGLLPKMNELYLFTAEMASLTKALKAALRLSPTCPTNRLLAELQALVRRARKAVREGKGAEEESESEEEEEEEEGGEGADEASLLVTDLNLSTVVEESEDGEESEEEDESEDEEEEMASPPPTPSALASSPSSSLGPAADEVEQGQQRVQAKKPAKKSGSGRSWHPTSSSSQSHPMLAVLSALESQESPFLPPPARRQQQQQQQGAGRQESPDLFVASSKFGATDASTSSSVGYMSVQQSGAGGGMSFGDSYLQQTHPGRSTRSKGSGEGSLGLLGVLSAAESGGSLPSPAPGGSGAADHSLSLLSSDGGVQ